MIKTSKEYFAGATYSPLHKIWFKKQGIIPYPYQNEAISFGRNSKMSYIALDMGMGKSFVGIEIVKKIGSNIIICPAILKHNWKDELIKFGEKKEIF